MNISVTFGWDASTNAGLAGYRLYKSDKSGAYIKGADFAEAETTDTDTTLTIIVPDGKWYFVLTSHDTDGNESLFSKEVVLLASPKNFRIQIATEVNQ